MRNMLGRVLETEITFLFNHERMDRASFPPCLKLPGWLSHLGTSAVEHPNSEFLSLELENLEQISMANS